MFKYYFTFFIFLSIQLFVMFMWAEYIGGGGTVLDQIPPPIFILIILECSVFYFLVSYERNRRNT